MPPMSRPRSRQYKATPFPKGRSTLRRSYANYGLTQAGRKIKATTQVVPLRTNRTGELKVVDLAPANYVMDSVGTVTALNLTATGDDNSSRDGRQITVRSCQIRGYVSPVDDLTTDTLCRWLLVWDKQPNGALAAVTDILASASSLAMTNLNNRERFVILRDKQYAVGKTNNTATQAVANSPNNYDVNEYVKINAITTYSQTIGTIAAVSTGALLLVTIGFGAVGGGGQLGASTRVRFTE